MLRIDLREQGWEWTWGRHTFTITPPGMVVRLRAPRRARRQLRQPLRALLRMECVARG
jgi:hypothetical protein